MSLDAGPDAGRRLVVAAVLVKDGRVLAARRSRPANLSGLWEFPGGKVEPDESPRSALARELREELGCRVEVLDELVGDAETWPIDDRLEMRVFECRLAPGSEDPSPWDSHDELCWVEPTKLTALSWLPADIAVARAASRPGALQSLLGQAGSAGAPRRPVLIANPMAGHHGQVLLQVRERAARLGWPPVEVLPTTASDFGAGQARAAMELGADRVLVAGGDGTVRQVAQQLRGSGVPLGIIPVGTANIFARNLGLSPHRLPEAVEAAMANEIAKLDLGVARFAQEGDDDQAEELFLVLAGIGHDANTVAQTRAALKRRIGWIAYFESGLRHLLRRPVHMSLSVDGQASQRVFLWSLLVGNAGRIPLGIQVFPGADLRDGWLRTLQTRVERWWHWGAVALAAVFPHRDSPVLVRGQARTVSVSLEEPCIIQLDGDVFGPIVYAEVSVDPGALSVCVPQGLHSSEGKRS
ncbi:diacylglycerol kinase family protein [Luteococcus sp. OSA5]|uniref:diacylglycerol kinase family protein n=1 Tax=Luteococcus sp. OSA5 TaxID=3401630 RepID=UPI003B42ACB0